MRCRQWTTANSVSSTWWRCRASVARPSRASIFPDRDRLLHEFLVATDAQVRQHGILNAPIAPDQEGCAPHADAERPVDAIGLDRVFLLVRKQQERQSYSS